MITVASYLVVLASFHWALVKSDFCPNNIDCGQARCCATQQGDYYCCPADTNNQHYAPDQQDRVYLVGMSSWWKDYWGVVIGCLIASIVISVILSVLCCIFCNGCWWHRRRNPGMYGGAFPLGTLFINPFPPSPPWYDDSTYSHNGERHHRVRFDDDLSSTKTYDNPKSVLKNKSTTNGHVLNTA